MRVSDFHGGLTETAAYTRIGATVEIETAAGKQVRPLVLARGYLSSSEPMVHFGLGAETAVRRLTVHWPRGAVQTFRDLAADQRYTITEPAAAMAPISAPRLMVLATSSRRTSG